MSTQEVDKNISILVVDDQPMTRNMVRAILRSMGFYQIIMADSGHQAVELIKEEMVDLIVCDWNMPMMSGLEFLVAVRSKPMTRNTPFIMLTAEAYQENVKAAIDAGVSDYVIKPFTAEVLTRKVTEVLSRKKVFL